MSEIQGKVNLLYEWLTDCDKEDIILCFKGDFNQNLVNAIVMLTEREPDIHSGSTLVRSRVFSVLVECMQNIRKYGAELSSGADLKPGIVVVSYADSGYMVSTGNFVTGSQVEGLRKQLDALQGLSKEQLKAMHKQILMRTELSEKSGAGLGLISIARKGDRLQYNFRPCEGDLFFYTLSVHIAK